MRAWTQERTKARRREAGAPNVRMMYLRHLSLAISTIFIGRPVDAVRSSSRCALESELFSMRITQPRYNAEHPSSMCTRQLHTAHAPSALVCRGVASVGVSMVESTSVLGALGALRVQAAFGSETGGRAHKTAGRHECAAAPARSLRTRTCARRPSACIASAVSASSSQSVRPQSSTPAKEQPWTACSAQRAAIVDGGFWVVSKVDATARCFGPCDAMPTQCYAHAIYHAMLCPRNAMPTQSITQCCAHAMLCLCNAMPTQCCAHAMLCPRNAVPTQCYAHAMLCLCNAMPVQCYAHAMLCPRNAVPTQCYAHAMLCPRAHSRSRRIPSACQPSHKQVRGCAGS
jgi:hypothetical protein